MKSSIVFLIATIVHIMCTFVSFIFSGSFDDIGQEHTLYEKLLRDLSSILLWPGSWIHSVIKGNDAIEWIIIICNSLFWGALITCLIIIRRRTKKSHGVC